MSNMKWLGMCRWVHVLLVFCYVFVTIMILIVLLLVFGLRMANGLRWLTVMGWFALCFGGVLLVEWMGLFFGQGWRRPIRAEEERLVALMDDIQKRAGSKRPVRFLIGSEPEKPARSFGYRTVLIQSGTLPLASDGELSGILAHELGHLRDGDRLMEAAFATAGMMALSFRRVRQLVQWGFRLPVVAGLLLLVALSPLLLMLFIFYVLDSVFRGLIWVVKRWIDYRQDAFAFRMGCGDGLRAWLERSGLAANADRIRRLEKML